MHAEVAMPLLLQMTCEVEEELVSAVKRQVA